MPFELRIPLDKRKEAFLPLAGTEVGKKILLVA
jgi:hypothetical protein